MNEFFQKFYTYSITMCFPLAIALFLILSILIAKYFGINIQEPYDEFKRKKKRSRPYNIYEPLDETVMWFGRFLVVVLFFVPIFMLNFNISCSVNSLIKLMEYLLGIMMTITGIVVPVALVVASVDKQYYIVFSIREVLRNYRFQQHLFFSLISCAVAIIVTLVLQVVKKEPLIESEVLIFTIFEMAVLTNFISNSRILYRIVRIVFSDKKGELKLLKFLYRVFWSREIDTSSLKKKKWDDDAVELNLSYLEDWYIRLCNKRKVRSIKSLKFATTIGNDKHKWCKRAARRISWFIFASTVFSCVVDVRAYGRVSRILWLNCLTMILLIVFLQKQMPKNENQPLSKTAICAIRWAFDTWGYQLTIEGHKRADVFIARVPLIGEHSLYNRYLMSMNSMIAFFYLWINYGDKDLQMIKKKYLELIDDFEDVEEKNIVTYQPILVIGCMLFEKGEFIEELKGIYKQIVTSNKKNLEFEMLMDGQMFYMEKYRAKELLKYRENLKWYLCWLEH